MQEALPFGAGATPNGDPTLLSNMITALMGLPKRAVDASKADVAHYAEGGLDKTSQTVGPAAETAMALMGTGAPAAEAGAAGIFGGKLARGADLNKLAQAQYMKNAEELAPAIIRKETGWMHTPTDNQWKFEIPDTDMMVHSHGLDYSKEGNFFTGPAEAMIQHPELFQHYPQLKDLQVYNTVLQNPKNGIGRGSFSPSQGILEMEAPSLVRAKIVGAHELQHAVQDIEGFSPGGNPSMMAGYKEKAPHKLPIWEQKNNPHDMYERLAGEVEARNVMHRSIYPRSELQSTHPWETMDTPYDQQLMYHPQKDLITALRGYK